MVIGSRVSGYKQKNQESIEEIKERHNKLNFQIRNNKRDKFVQCQNENCGRWVKCHYPQRKLQNHEVRRITDIVPLYPFNESEKLYCGQCFSTFYSEKY
jgi:hypothetical protein